MFKKHPLLFCTIFPQILGRYLTNVIMSTQKLHNHYQLQML